MLGSPQHSINLQGWKCDAEKNQQRRRNVNMKDRPTWGVGERKWFVKKTDTPDRKKYSLNSTSPTERALAVLSVFLATGLMLVIYLNQYDPQPRERDYSYVGSFFAFSIWVGLGLFAIYDFLIHK